MLKTNIEDIDEEIITSWQTENIKPMYWEDEKEPLHIIEELKPKEEIETFIIRYPDNQELMNKINEIIEVVNIMMRGGLR